MELHEITRNYTKDINAGGTMRVMMHQMKDVVKRGSEKANMDFTVKKYKKLCLALLDSGYTPLTVESYLTGKQHNSKFIVLRHDIDRKPMNALKMAELEDELGIQSTYHFRFPYTFKPVF